jgi:hypothetical protein
LPLFSTGRFFAGIAGKDIFMKPLVVLCIAIFSFLTGCGAPEPTAAERKQQQDRAAKEEQEQAIRRAEGELRMKALENARAIRERAYCAPSPEALGKLYELLKNGDSERATAIAELTGADVLEPKTRILVLQVRPFYQGIGANLVRIGRTRQTCYVPNRALVD